jgi:hypothetical protein
MLGLSQLGDNAQAAQQAFDGFYFWSAIRGGLQTLAFAANVWALAVLPSRGRLHSAEESRNGAPSSRSVAESSGTRSV